MKNLLKYIAIIMMTLSLYSCDDVKPYYPTYQIIQYRGIPDSLKANHGDYILKMVNAGYENGSGSQNIDDILDTSKRIADRMFTTKIIGLKKELNGDSDDDLFIRPNNFTPLEARIFEHLSEDTSAILTLSNFKAIRNVENEQAK